MQRPSVAINSLLRFTFALLLSLTASACSHVEAWQKEHLAATHMRFDRDPLESLARQHMYTSREAANGGYGISGGGCGCN